ncbi:hypothetical protein DVH05_013234 [Phytophthora capsici]|nr:hypothetical protein DVH05_013234 [Phytophthora capsici]
MKMMSGQPRGHEHTHKKEEKRRQTKRPDGRSEDGGSDGNVGRPEDFVVVVRKQEAGDERRESKRWNGSSHEAPISNLLRWKQDDARPSTIAATVAAVGL